jgi:hypothetical protein
MLFAESGVAIISLMWFDGVKWASVGRLSFALNG